jgi:hypothetical protein
MVGLRLESEPGTRSRMDSTGGARKAGWARPCGMKGRGRKKGEREVGRA